jgi:hypothetical protein
MLDKSMSFVGYLMKSVVSEDYVQLECVIYGLEGNFYDVTELLSIRLSESTEEDHEKLQNVIFLNRDSKQRSSEYKPGEFLLCQFVPCPVRNSQYDVILFSTNKTGASNA